MANITNYTTLVAEIDGAAGWSHRTDLTSRLPQFVALAEAAMQVECKMVEFEGTATITITAGVGTVPTDFLGMRSIYWNGDLKRPLTYISPDKFDALRNDSGTPSYYTISGTTIRLAPSATGSAITTYHARFSPISASNETNAIITNFPDAYLFGTLVQIALWAEDDAKAQKYTQLFGGAIDRIKKNNSERKWAGPLTVRPR
jgi:hypothetical protein